MTGIAYSLAMAGLYAVPVHIGLFTAYMLGCLAGFGVMYGLERENGAQKFFLSVAFFSLRWLAFIMAELLYDNLYSFLENTRWYRENYSPAVQASVYVGVCAFYLILFFAIMAGAVTGIVKSYVYKREPMSARELLMLSIPPVLGAAGCKIIRYYRISYLRDAGELSVAYDLLLLFYCAVAVATIVVLIVLYQRIKASQEEKLTSRFALAQADDLKRHIEQVEGLYRDIRSLKHDMTNHVLTLERLYAAGEKKEAEDYVESLKEALVETAGDIRTGNPVTDVILREWKKTAENKGIQFQCDFQYPADADINVFDISIILNNAMQNAAENAGAEGGYISVLSYRRGNAYMIEIRNSFDGELRRDREGGLPVTSKEKDGTHGYGLSNIRRIAGKYFGDIDCAAENGEFILSVMLMLR